MNITNKHLLISMSVIIIMLIGFVFFFEHKLNESKSDNNAALQALSNEFKTAINKNGQEVATVPAAVFATMNGFKTAVDQLKKNGVNIQSKVDNNTQSLTLLSKNVGGILTGNTAISYDTIKSPGKPDSLSKCNPTYTFNSKEKWYSISGSVNSKTFAIKPIFYDSTELRVQNSPFNLLKAKTLNIEVLNKNPYTSTTGLKYLEVKTQPAPVWKYIQIIGGFAGGLYIGRKL